MKEKSSLEIAIENGRELIEFFKDKWTKEELDKQLKLQELSEYNLSLWEDDRPNGRLRELMEKSSSEHKDVLEYLKDK